MTKRSIQSSPTPTVIVRAGGSATIEGWQETRVQAETHDRWGLKVERQGEAIEVTAGGTCVVRVPVASTLKVHTGKSADIQGIRGEVVAASTGGHLTARNVYRMAGADAGRRMDIAFEELLGDDVKYSSGGDLRLHLRHLNDARVMINDLGGYWEVVFGEGTRRIRLKAGGDVTLVTEEEPAYVPEILGSIERPGD